MDQAYSCGGNFNRGCSFFLGYLLQVTIGHSILERGKNNFGNEFAKFLATGNPVIFLFIFGFPYLQLYNSMGWDKEEFARILQFKL